MNHMQHKQIQLLESDSSFNIFLFIFEYHHGNNYEKEVIEKCHGVTLMF